MSSKRKAGAEAAPPQEPKRRVSKGTKLAEPKVGKRKIEEEEGEEPKPAKKASVKRSSTPQKERRSSSSGPAASPAVKVKKGKAAKVNVEVEEHDDEDEEEVVEEAPKSVKKLKKSESAAKKDGAVKPRASEGNISRAEIAAASRHQSAGTGAPTSEDEMVSLWQQYWTSLDMCMSTVTPLFLTLVLALYAFSVMTKSQTIASIGLVYVFVFLIIMGSYFFAIVPFILVSNAISSVVAPGKTAQKDFVRLALLVLSVGGLVAYVKHGLPKM